MRQYHNSGLKIQTTPKQLSKSLKLMFKGFLESELYNHLSKDEIQKVADDFLFLTEKVRK